MPVIHVARDGAKLGEFTLEEIRQGLTTGQFRSTDLGWQSGMAEWRPLSEFVGAPSSASPAVAAPAAAAPSSGLPWENRQQLGFIKAWFDTVALLITKPGEAFAMMRPEGGLMDPLLFGLIGGCAGAIISIMIEALMPSVPGFGGNPDDFFRAIGISRAVFFVGGAVLSPLLVALGLFIGSGILHLCLMLVGGANRSFETTFRVACFSGGAANLFYIIPICGRPIAAIYQIVLNCIGLTRAHQTTIGKALLAIFLPLIICCAVCILFGVILGGFGAFMNKH
jgi:hypothetical protein